MNLLASYTWIRDYLKTKTSVEEFAQELSLRSNSVEEVIDLRSRYEYMVIGLVESIENHPQADRLSIVKTNINQKTISIVCGGKNVHVGQKVIVALPGARVKWHGEGDLITLEPATIRGIASEGMICAPSEIGFEKVSCEENCIWDITNICDAPAGTTLIDAFKLNDTLFDIEVTTNRSDAMSIIGLAREASACGLGTFTWKPSALPKKTAQRLPLTVRVDASDVCPRYMAIAFDNVVVAPSPLWLQIRLLLAGHRPINNVVDITNYILHEYGQPLHAFDYNCVKHGSIVVRKAQLGEKIKALDSKEYELKSDHLVIADDHRALAIAGVMGGEESGISNQTTQVVLEGAMFDGGSIRRTARDLNLYSDAQSLFEKGLSTESLPPALARAIELMQEIVGARIASDVVDVQEKKYQPLVCTLNPVRVSQMIGVDISEKDQIHILESLGFTCQKTAKTISVEVPYWRDHDIEHDIDLVEEIARVFGYHNIPSRLPEGRLPIREQNPYLFWEEQWKRQLVAYGYTEFFGNSLVSAQDLERVNVSPSDAVQLFNPLTEELTHMRTTLVPSLLKGIELNQAHHKHGQVFEIARVYTPQKNDLPIESSTLLLAQFGYTNALQVFRELKGTLDMLLKQGGMHIVYERIHDHSLLHTTRSAKIMFGAQEIGYIGEIREDIAKRFGVDLPVCLAVIDAEQIIPMLRMTRSYTSAPAFPSVLRDLSFFINRKTTFEEIQKVIMLLDKRIYDIDFKDQYMGEGIAEDEKSMTLGITLRDEQSTLDGSAVEEMMNRIIKSLENTFSARMR